MDIIEKAARSGFNVALDLMEARAKGFSEEAEIKRCIEIVRNDMPHYKLYNLQQPDISGDKNEGN